MFKLNDRINYYSVVGKLSGSAQIVSFAQFNQEPHIILKDGVKLILARPKFAILNNNELGVKLYNQTQSEEVFTDMESLVEHYSSMVFPKIYIEEEEDEDSND